MKENAILVRPLDIIKIYVDFSNTDNIYEVINAERLSTIHTAQTQKLSALLGIHLMGFVNRDGDDINNSRACQISGYDYLGSNMLLCKTDDKLNPLPFSEAELNSVYTYLTTGKNTSSSLNQNSSSFIEKHNILPVLPEFGIEPKELYSRSHPNVIVFQYDFSNLDDDKLLKIGENLFNYSSRLIDELINIDQANSVFVDASRTYYLHNYFPEDHQSYYVLIQAISSEDERPILLDISWLLKLGGKYGVDEEIPHRQSTEPPKSLAVFGKQAEQTRRKKYENQVSKEEFDEEDETEYNDDLLMPYIVRVKANIKWPNLKDTYTEYDQVFPLFMMSQEPIRFSYFTNRIKVKEIDTWNGEADFYVMLDYPVKLHLELDKPQTIEFDYYTNDEQVSRRVGSITVSIEQHEFDIDQEVNGTVKIVEEVLLPGESKSTITKLELVNPNTFVEDESRNCEAESDFTSYWYVGFLVQPDENLVLIVQKILNEAGDGFDKTYYIVKPGEDNVYRDNSYDEENEDYFFVNIRYTLAM